MPSHLFDKEYRKRFKLSEKNVIIILIILEKIVNFCGPICHLYVKIILYYRLRYTCIIYILTKQRNENRNFHMTYLLFCPIHIFHHISAIIFYIIYSGNNNLRLKLFNIFMQYFLCNISILKYVFHNCS